MQKFSAWLTAGALTVALAVPLSAQDVDISGQWELTRARAGGPGGGGGGGGGREGRGGGEGGGPRGGGPAKMVIQQEGNSFTGTLELPFGEAQIEDGVINGSEISFKVFVETPRGSFEMTYTGKIEGEAMAGSWTGNRSGRSGGGGRGGGGEGMTREWSAKKIET